MEIYAFKSQLIKAGDFHLRPPAKHKRQEDKE
jgi:hypothetical protein